LSVDIGSEQLPEYWPKAFTHSKQGSELSGQCFSSNFSPKVVQCMYIEGTGQSS
jgi:hypothetical protein